MVREACRTANTWNTGTVDQTWDTVSNGLDIFGMPCLEPVAKRKRPPSAWTTARARRPAERADLVRAVCSSCSLLDDDDLAACDKCGCWMHFKCAHISATALRKTGWHCAACIAVHGPPVAPIVKRRRKKGEPVVARTALSTRASVITAVFTTLLEQLRLEVSLWPSVTREQQLGALTSPLTASELEGSIGVVKAHRDGAPRRTEPFLRAILLGRRLPDVGGDAPVAFVLHRKFLMETARWLLREFSHTKPDRVRGERKLRGRTGALSHAASRARGGRGKVIARPLPSSSDPGGESDSSVSDSLSDSDDA